jgi:hypothetical protein
MSATCLNPRFDFIVDHEFNYTSQFGEDGFIAAMLDEIGIKNKWCFEVGAADGDYYSNTKRLRERNWDSVLIEGPPRHWEALQKHASIKARTIQEMIGPDSLDRILASVGAPEDMDLGVIDIDGQEYWCWKGMQRFKPRLMLVEYCPYGDAPQDFIAPLNGEGQTGINPLLALGREKGYAPVVSTFCNILFVREDAACV